MSPAVEQFHARCLRRPRALRLLAAAALLVLQGLTGAAAASAHEGGTGDEGYVLVQQAIGYLLNMAEPEASTHAQEKVSAALAATDQEGVSVAMLKQAQAALRANHPEAARALLQESISEAVTMLEPAKGEETGTGNVLVPMGAAPISELGWAFLAASVVAVAAGIWLAAMFRPRESVSELRRTMDLPRGHRGARQEGAEEDKRQ